MSTIVQLEETLSNKIAAGEVVERPASVVKELLENALDAGSSRIDIEIDEGGLARIHVLDNGAGIPPEEAEQAFQRHATSKIKDEDDLHHIRTLGFRGEALPSIASVSKLTMETSQGGEAGASLRYQGGRLIARAKSKARQGTSILVEELFFNTPARLKYMKTVNTELGNVNDIVNRTALARPDVSFRLTHNGKQLLFTSGNGDQKAVIYAVYGKQVAENMLTMTGASLDYEIKGFVARPEINRANRHYISTFINGRYIKHFPLLKAIERAYQTLLPIHRYPIAVLSIKMDPTLVDVNVHPSKWDVRLSKEDALLTEVSNRIRERLQQETLIPETKEPEVASFKRKEVNEVRELPLHFKSDPEPKTPSSMSTVHYSGQAKEEPAREEEQAGEEEPNVEKTIASEKISAPAALDTSQEIVEHDRKARIPVIYPIGQLHGTYILGQNDNGLYMVDQHAAQERINYEYYRTKLGEPVRASQSLLVPLTMTFSPQEAGRIEELQVSLEQVGLFMEPFGINTFRVSAHPSWFPKGLEEETIRELMDQVLTVNKPEIGTLREAASILIACKAAIKANRHLRNDETFALLERLRFCDDPFTCPHGRPIFVHISSYELEKMFKRTM